MPVKKYIFILVVVCSIPAAPLSAQLERGNSLLECGFSYRYSQSLSDVFDPAVGFAPPDAYSRTQHWGLGGQVGGLGKKHREWGVSLYWVKEKNHAFNNRGIPPYDGYTRDAKAVRGSLYHRKYYAFTDRLWAGYQLNLSMATSGVTTAYYAKLGDGALDVFSGPLEIGLHANLFLTAFLSRHIGARLTLGNVGLGYRIQRDYYQTAVDFENTRLLAYADWQTAGMAQFSLFWVVTPPRHTTR